MALESVTGITDLVITNPTATDGLTQGDDHIRNIKKALKADFAGITGVVTATHTELNLLDGVTSTTAELNILDGVTSTAAEINILDGVTSTTAELNILDGVTSTAAELNILDGVTSTTTELNLLDGVTATTTEINTVADGITATAAAINTVCDGAAAGAVTWNPPSIAAYGSASTTDSTTGAVGDFVVVSYDISLSGLVPSARVSATNTITLTLHNPTSGAIDLGSTDFYFKVLPRGI